MHQDLTIATELGDHFTNGTPRPRLYKIITFSIAFGLMFTFVFSIVHQVGDLQKSFRGS